MSRFAILCSRVCIMQLSLLAILYSSLYYVTEFVCYTV